MASKDYAKVAGKTMQLNKGDERLMEFFSSTLISNRMFPTEWKLSRALKALLFYNFFVNSN